MGVDCVWDCELHVLRSKFRYAIALSTIFGAFITPDGSGVSMWFVSGPMIVLYSIGMLIVESSMVNDYSKRTKVKDK